MSFGVNFFDGLLRIQVKKSKEIFFQEEIECQLFSRFGPEEFCNIWWENAEPESELDSSCPEELFEEIFVENTYFCSFEIWVNCFFTLQWKLSGGLSKVHSNGPE